MQLTVEEQRILNGEQGDVVRKYMELLVRIGEAYDAPSMIPTRSVHVTSVGIANLRPAGRMLIESMANSGARFKAFTTVNPLSMDRAQWRELSVSEEELAEQIKVVDMMRSMGAIMCNTCISYLVGHVPRFGEHIAWSEAHAVIYANSVLGARTNPEGGPSALAASLTGRTPLYGLHLDENRLGQFVIRVKTELKEPVDYGTLADFAGVHPELVPVFVGIPQQVTCDDLKMLSGSLHSKSSAKLFHAVGITPEARTEEQALGGRKPVDTVDFGQKELEEITRSLDKATRDEVSWVTIGCPHCSISEIADVARLLNGRKVNSNVALWVFTPQLVKVLADSMGFTEVIERAGGRIVCETCPILLTKESVKNLGFQSLTTNSTVIAHILPTIHALEIHYGSLKRCIDAAISGTWR